MIIFGMIFYVGVFFFIYGILKWYVVDYILYFGNYVIVCDLVCGVVVGVVS